jgi:hypothetical protein
MPDDLAREHAADDEIRAATEHEVAAFMASTPRVHRSADAKTTLLFTPDPARSSRRESGRRLLEQRKLGGVFLEYFGQLLKFEKYADSADEYGPFIAVASVIVEAGLDRLVTASARAEGLFPELQKALNKYAGAHPTEYDEVTNWAAGRVPPGRSREPTLFTHQAVTRALCYGVRDGSEPLKTFVTKVFPAECHKRLNDLSFAAAVDHLRKGYRNKANHPPTRRYNLGEYREFARLAVGAESFTEWNLYVADEGPPADGVGIMNPLARGGAAAGPA